LKILLTFLSGNHASVKTEVFLLPVMLSAWAAKNDFQSGKGMLAIFSSISLKPEGGR
jgi:hypothetical protein